MNNPTNTMGTPYARNLTVVKNYFKKPLTLIVAILSLVTLIVTVVVNSKSGALMASAANYFDMELEPSGAGENIISYLISGIVIACIFMIFFLSCNSSPSVSPSPFFGILHVLSLIELIVTAIGAALIVIVTAIFAVTGSSMIESALGEDASEELLRNINSYKITIIVVLAIMIAIIVLALCYVNSQTAFLKSCQRSCKEPLMMKKGAKTYGNLSIVLAILQLIIAVVCFLFFNTSDMSTLPFDDELKSYLNVYLVYFVASIVRLLLIGVVASGYHKCAVENETYQVSAAAARAPEVNPIPTYRADTRSSNNAVRQSQPYLYGEEENTDPNKKSQYIPEELQQDAQPQYDPQMNPYEAPMQYDPQYGQGSDSYTQPNPYGQNDMYGQGIPYGQGDPYGQPMQNPNSHNPYNNGMM